MEYNNCQHKHDKNCSECRCYAWCNKVLTCVCGCHNKPTYSYSDYTMAQFAAIEARDCLAIKAEQQSQERIKIETRLAQLNKELMPFQEKHKQTTEKLVDLKRRLLGPWEDSHNYGSYSHIYILIASAQRTWYHKRVWLRVVKRDYKYTGWHWEVSINGLEERQGNLDVDLGPPSSTMTCKDELEIMKLKAEPYIIKMGYILPIK